MVFKETKKISYDNENNKKERNTRRKAPRYDKYKEIRF